MIEATFYKNKGFISGFLIRGHSGYAEEGSDVICASVSSAAYMAANTLTEIVGVKADIAVEDGCLELTLKEANDKTEIVLQGLELHISTLAQDYDEYILCRQKTL
ncbi:MAG: ribosomal-processing cysteine protease Prp [Clostridia bacterium]|nr:ribosomal-processing cysteine protease Prp [Clostridia bacterium]